MWRCIVPPPARAEIVQIVGVLLPEIAEQEMHRHGSFMGDVGSFIRFPTTRSREDGGASASSARAERAQHQNHLMHCIGSASVEKEALDGSSPPDTLPHPRPDLSLYRAGTHGPECFSCLAISNTCCAFPVQRLSPDPLALLFSSGQSRRERVLEAIGANAHEPAFFTCVFGSVIPTLPKTHALASTFAGSSRR